MNSYAKCRVCDKCKAFAKIDKSKNIAGRSDGQILEDLFVETVAKVNSLTILLARLS